jgi:hypothetical protein
MDRRWWDEGELPPPSRVIFCRWVRQGGRSTIIDDDIHQIIILKYQQSALMTDFFLV